MAALAILKKLGIDPASKIVSQNGSSGTGAEPGASGGLPGTKNIRRSDFDKLDPVAKAQKMREGWTVID